MKTLFIVLCCFTIISCAKTENLVTVKTTINDGNNIDLKEKLYQRKVEIDTLFKNKIEEVLVLVKSPGSKELVKVNNEVWPDELEITYNVLYNSAGKVVRISESPYSESGDWSIVYSYYFDDSEHTFAIEKTVSAFNTFCPDNEDVYGFGRESIIKLYDLNHSLIDSIYKMENENGVDITKMKCQQEVSSDDRVYQSLHSYLLTQNIKLKK